MICRILQRQTKRYWIFKLCSVKRRVHQVCVPFKARVDIASDVSVKLYTLCSYVRHDRQTIEDAPGKQHARCASIIYIYMNSQSSWGFDEISQHKPNVCLCWRRHMRVYV